MKYWRIFQGLAACVLSTANLPGADALSPADRLPELPPGQNWTLAWNDEFDGPVIDPAKWEVMGDWKRRDGFWMREDSYLENGQLILRTARKGDRFSSGAVRTRGKFERAFGYFVVRCQLPEQPGHWPAFWLMCDGVTKLGNEGRDGTEIDIVEIPWRDGRITMNVHWDGYGKEHKSAGTKITIPALTNGFHTFALWWKTNEYVFYTDGQETWRTAAGGVSQVPEFIKLTEEIGKWGGDIQKATLPDRFIVDYVRVYKVTAGTPDSAMQAACHPESGQIDITESGKPVLRYNYETVAPGARLSQIHSNNLQYARARSDYIHPLFGFDGEELTRDWPVDHPHHRGIYWAWPEVHYRGEGGDLHALQRVFARPTGIREWRSGKDYAQIQAENLWMWEDREEIVRERAIIRAYRQTESGRCIDLELHFIALKDGVTIARRGTDRYGGLNIRLAPIANQRITPWTGPAVAQFPIAWAQISGVWGNSTAPLTLLILQKTTNPDYPGDWVQFPEINWIQPAFPAAGTRFPLKKEEPLVLAYRLWISRAGRMPEETCSRLWTEYNREGGNSLEHPE